MRLDEIFGKPTIIRNRTTNDDYNRRYSITSRAQAAAKTKLASGYFSYVQPNPKDIGGVIKSNLIAAPLKYDPFFLFVKYITENHLAESNTYLPRIYSITTNTGSAGKALYRIQAEKLTETGDISDEQFEGLFRSMGKFNEEKMEKEGIDLQEYMTSNFKWEVVLEKLIYDYAHNQSVYSPFQIDTDVEYAITDQNFYRAIDIWRYVKGGHDDFEWDVHDANFMFRPIGNGVQLVLTDLLYNVKMKAVQYPVRDYF